ncbi:MAG: hypothetical protein K2J67_07355 [Lachnospiraceae bacterium]|nr:hypothetical protein [Lachnospiraceae bacterium]
MSDMRVNAGFVIANAISVGDKEFVLGVNMKNAQSFVTWECIDKADYYWGHYTDSLLKATKDLCERVRDEIEYLENLEHLEKRETKKKPGNRYSMVASVMYEGNYARIQFPTKELGSMLESIGITLPPERVYLGSHLDIEVYLQHDENKTVDALVHLFRENNSLRMVNEVAKAVFHSDWRVYEWVEEKLKMGSYSDVENLLRDAVDYSKYVKDKQSERREER